MFEIFPAADSSRDVDLHTLESHTESQEECEEEDSPGPDVPPVHVAGDGAVVSPLLLLLPYRRDETVVILIVLEVITEPGHPGHCRGRGGQSEDLVVDQA